MLWAVPPAKAQIKTAHERDGLVNDAKLLMLDELLLDQAPQPRSRRAYMGPIKCPGLEVRRRPLDHDVGMKGS